MMYNTTAKFGKFIEGPSQEEIYNCPYYFSMSFDQIKAAGCPQFLTKILDQFPWDGRQNIISVRPQDFRNDVSDVSNSGRRDDGKHWHTDYNIRLVDKDGVEYKTYAKHIDEFHLMNICWGAGYPTEFITTPMDLPDNFSKEGWVAWNEALDKRLQEPFEIKERPEGQLVEYTARDIHRGKGVQTSYGLRLIIIAYDTDSLVNLVRIHPSIKQLDDEK